MLQGVDMQKVSFVGQWKCTCSSDTLWQRFGRAARDPSRSAIAVLFAEPKHFDEWKEAEAKRMEERERRAVERAVAKEKSKRVATDMTNSPERPSKRKKSANPGNLQKTKGADEAASELLAQGGDDVEGGDGLSTYASLRVEFNRVLQAAKKKRSPWKSKDVNDEMVDPVLDAMVNAKRRGYKCYRAPITAFYHNDHFGTLLLR